MDIRKLLPLGLVLLIGCALTTFQSTYMYSGGRYGEIIHLMEEKQARGEQIPLLDFYLLCTAYYEVKQFDKLFPALDAFEKRIAAGEKAAFGEDVSLYPHVIRADGYLDLGEYDKVVKETMAAETLLRQDSRDKRPNYDACLIPILGPRGIAHALVGQRAEAAKDVEALSLIDTNDPRELLRPAKFMAIAKIHMANKEFDKAMAAIKNPENNIGLFGNFCYAVIGAERTWEQVPMEFITNKCLCETGHTDEARQGYDKLLQNPVIADQGGIYWLVLYDRARIARAAGQSAEAKDFLKKAVEIIERQRASIDTETGRIGFVGDKQAVYQELVSLLLGEKQDAEAFEYVERAKARALVDLLASQKDIAVRSEKADQVRSTMAELTKAEVNARMVRSATAKESADQTRSVVLSLENELAAAAPEVASLVAVRSTPILEIQKLLPPDEDLLEYYYTDKEFWVFLLSREGIKAVKLERAGLENNVGQFRAAIANPSSSDYALWSQKLYEQLFKPVSGMVRHEKLSIVPHGVLHYLPFIALNSGKETVVDRYTVRTLPSASVVKFLKAPKEQGVKKALILGNPDLGDPKLDLKFAQDEALAIAKVLPQSKVLLRGEATKTFVRNEGAQYRIIHFATHGLVDPNQPLNSALLLARDAQSDGLLRVGDLYALTLDADLVTLSACETALGKVANGDDVVGFTRGLLYAGAGSIVSSLWKVDDKATRDLMVDFYTNLAKTGKPEALRQAQLSAKKKYPHPFYWAAFVFTGSAE